MTTTLVFASTSDGYVTSYSTDYTTARNGGGTFFVSAASSASLVAGQQQDSTNGYGISQAFMRFTYTLPANEVAASAAIRLRVNSATDGATDRALEVRSYDYAAAVGTEDFRTPAQLSAAALLATMNRAQASGGSYIMAGSAALMGLVSAASGAIPVVIGSSTARVGSAPRPGTEQQHYMSSADEAGTTNDPCLILSSVRRSTLFGVRSAQVKLSDGTWAILESNGAATPTITLRKHTGTAATTIATIGSAFAAPRGPHSYSLAVDSADNVYVLGPASASPQSIAVQAFAKSGASWTPGTAQTIALGSSAAPINQVAGTWTNPGGTGIVLVLVSYSAGTSYGSDAVRYASLSAAALLSGSGTVSLGIGTATGLVLPDESTPAGYADTFPNEVGSGLDVTASTDAGIGFVASMGAGAAPGDVSPVGAGRWTLTSAGALSGVTTATPARPYKDPNTRVRIVHTGGSTVAVVTVDPASTWGLTVTPYQATASGWTALSAPVRLDQESITNMPTPSALAAGASWDAAWSDFDNMLLIYFRDSTNTRTVRRTRVNLSTYQAVRDSVAVTTVGASGGQILVFRAAKNRPAGAAVLLSLAYLDTDGVTLSTLYYQDAYNSPPTAPTLIPKTNYDATVAGTFTWVFNDPNLPAGDGQSAYQLQIVNADTSATVVDTGKLTGSGGGHTLAAGTLTNGVNYQWRVMTWDLANTASPWSGYGTFSTSAGGSVSITTPAADNPADAAAASYTIKWAVTGTTQAKVRTWTTRNDTGAIVDDSGWFTYAGTVGSANNMVSGVTHTVRVQVENASAVRSAIGTRLITPTFTNPDVPVVAVSSETDGGYMLVSVTNPGPAGDRPAVIRNEVYRRAAGAPVWAWALLGTTGPSTPFRDYTAAANTPYEYMARAIAATGATTDSATASGSLWLEGVWLHDSSDPVGTAVHFRYGKAARSGSLAVAEQATYYAGRTFPVSDFGAQESEEVAVRVDVPFGPTYLSDLEALKTLVRSRTPRVFRDNRGRVVTGTIAEFRDQDTETGSQVTFTVGRREV